MRFVKPLDLALLKTLHANHSHLVTLEDNALAGGAGSAVNEAIAGLGLSFQVLNLGLPDHFIRHGTQDELYQELGLDAAGIGRQIAHWLG
jgi:1-deoxy-D-xylulose-5-phosphate synthase